MEFTFLGTSSGTPTKTRNVSGLALTAGGRGWILIDCGEGTQHQLLHTPYSLHKLQAICITHVHGDHCYGLPGVLSSASMAGRKKPLLIIGPKELKPLIEITRDLTQLRLTYDLEFVAVEQEHQCSVAELSIEWTPLSHRTASYAYIFTERQQKQSLRVEKLRAENVPQGQIWGDLKRYPQVTLPNGRTLRSAEYLTNDEQVRKIVVGGDNDQPQLLAKACADAHVLIHEATYTEDIAQKVGPFLQHSSAASVAAFAQNVQIPHLFLTHFSPRYADEGMATMSLSDLEREARQLYEGKLFLAKDFASYRLTPDGQVEQVN